jgi:hypothetical protein
MFPVHQLKNVLHTCERTCSSTPGACSYHSCRTVSCCSIHSWETSCRCGPVRSFCTEKTLVTTLRVHAVTTANTRFPVAIITVGKPLADAGSSNHPEQRKHLLLHSGCMQLPQLPQGFLLPIVTVGKPLAEAGPSNHPAQRKHLFLHYVCMQLPQLPQGFLLQ